LSDGVNPLDEIEGEDSDVRAEKQRVNRGDFSSECPLVMQRLVKAYDNNYIAVKGMTLAVESDMVFGLLGPNGAGKTTTISILTGLYEATAGAFFFLTKVFSNPLFNLGFSCHSYRKGHVGWVRHCHPA
jgi:ABC-type polysaccharide/polyol phosphate transport system ATPase subunit